MTSSQRAVWLNAIVLGIGAVFIWAVPTLVFAGSFPWYSESKPKESEWKQWTQMTVHPLYDGQLLITQAPGGDPGGGPSFVGIRLYSLAKKQAFQLDEMDPIVKNLMEKVPKPESHGTATATGGQVSYFARKRFFLASAKPPVLILVPTQFDVPINVFAERNSYDLVNSAYRKIYKEEQRLGISGFARRVPNWYNYIDLSATFPNAQNIEVVSDLWPGPIPVEKAIADSRWPFRIEASPVFQGYLQLSPR